MSLQCLLTQLRDNVSDSVTYTFQRDILAALLLLAVSIGFYAVVHKHSKIMDNTHPSGRLGTRGHVNLVDGSLQAHVIERKTGHSPQRRHRGSASDSYQPSPVSTSVTTGKSQAVSGFGISSHTLTEASEREHGGREKLYEAYNELHAVAQVFSKPFDAPAILVVGHQTDGKSGTFH
jgi:hypothetical protein